MFLVDVRLEAGARIELDAAQPSARRMSSRARCGAARARLQRRCASTCCASTRRDDGARGGRRAGAHRAAGRRPAGRPALSLVELRLQQPRRILDAQADWTAQPNARFPQVPARPSTSPCHRAPAAPGDGALSPIAICPYIRAAAPIRLLKSPP
jgi:hypothetical protein